MTGTYFSPPIFHMFGDSVYDFAIQNNDGTYQLPGSFIIDGIVLQF